MTSIEMLNFLIEIGALYQGQNVFGALALSTNEASGLDVELNFG